MEDTAKKEILEAIACLSNKLDVMQEQVAKIPEIEKQVAKIPEIERQVAKIPEIEKQVAKIPGIEQQIAKLGQRVDKIEEKVDKIEEKISPIEEMQREIKSIARSVAIIEHEHGQKIQALFDAFVVNQEKNKEIEKKINICEKKIEKHDDEIYLIKTKIQSI